MLAIVNGKILTMAGRTFDPGTILIEEGRIVAVVEGQPELGDKEVIDANGKVITPGLIDAHCHVGLYEEGIGWAGNDINEMTDPVTPFLRAIDGINPEEQGLKDAVMGGVTTVCTGPGSSNVIGGQSVVIKTHGRVVDEMVLKAPAGLKVAFGENPKRCFEQKNVKTRMAVAAILRTQLAKAQDYLAKKQRATEDQVLDRDLGLEVIGQVLRREIPLRAHAHRADDIMTAIRIAEEFNVDLVLEHCTEGHKISDILAQRGYPAIVGPTHSSRSKYELKDTAPANPTILAKAGVLVALMTDHPVIPINHLILTASLAVKAGMDREEALRAVTINPAQILGVEKRVGSIEVGKDADLVLWSQDPLDVQAKAERVLINGKVVYQQ
ncbi:MAG TPA: amidohydrolase [Firmicutes bacterium]|nr:amidohydrolase [Bacillota bacterium]